MALALKKRENRPLLEAPRGILCYLKVPNSCSTEIVVIGQIVLSYDSS